MSGSGGRNQELMADHGIKGKTIIIAGGAKNLGGLIARDLAQQGARAVAIHYNSPATKADADATVAAVSSWRQAVALQADLSSAGAMENCSPTRWPSADIAINTVGKVLKKPFTEITEAEYDEMTAVNSKAAFFFAKRPPRQRQRQDLHAGHFAAGRLHAVLRGLRGTKARSSTTPAPHPRNTASAASR